MQEAEENARRLERINRNLIIGAVAIAIVMILLLILDLTS
jgi:hypothetical protein